MKLTKRLIESLKYEGANNSRDVRWSDELPGFGIRIYPSGKKAFVLSYRVSGRKRMLTIGRYGVYTLKQAEGAAKDFLRDISKNIDPLEQKENENNAKTVKELCEQYMEDHAKAKKRSWRDDQGRVNNHILPAWGKRKAHSIKRADMAAMHIKMGKDGHPYGANRTLRLISKMYKLAEQWGYVPEGFPNPARNIELFEEQERERWVSPEELPRLMQEVNKIENEYVRYSIWLYLLTGLRRSELLTAKWEQIDWTNKELFIPDTKAKRAHHVPLSEFALTILKDLPRIENNPYILPGKIEGQHLVNIYKPWNKIRKAAGMEDVRLHDLRRTVGSWMVQAGNSLHLIGKVLNHSNQSTTAIYARFDQEQVRNALEQHGKQIMGAAKGKQAKNVVQLIK